MPNISTELPVNQCFECENEFTTDNLFLHDGKLYCQDCESEKFCVCEKCEEFSSVDDSIEIDGHWFCCQRCANRAYFYECADCDTWFNSNQESYGENTGGECVCESCYEQYGRCERCEEIFNSDDLEYIDGNNYCEHCENSIRHNRIIRKYDYNPPRFLFDKMPWENTIFLGIELEVECRSNMDNEDMASKVIKWLEKNNVQDRVYIKEDGSLNNGFEIVFMPSTLQALHKRFPMRKFLAYLKKLGLSSHEHGTCGLHVHVSRSKLTARDLWAGKLFFFKCRSQLVKFSGREDSEEGLNYCKFDSLIPRDGISQDYGRYSAFNTSASRHTVELRLFRGTLQYPQFQASLQFSDLFTEFIQQASVVFLKTKTSEVIWGELLRFAKSKRKYGQFLKYIKQKGII